MWTLCRGIDRDNTNQLLVDKLLYAKTGKFTEFLNAAERKLRCSPGWVIHKDHPGLM